MRFAGINLAFNLLKIEYKINSIQITQISVLTLKKEIMFSKKLIVILGLLLFTVASLSAQNTYVGSAKCKMCHNKPEKGDQFKKWSDSKHSKAMSALKGDDAKNEKCLKCHSTYSSVDKKLVGTLTAAEGVSCESCHGAGSAYKSMPIMKDKAKAKTAGLVTIDEKVCIKCHNSESPNFKGFDFATYSAKIAHKAPVK